MLELWAAVPTGCAPAPIARRAVLRGRRFDTFGFPRANSDGVSVSGVIGWAARQANAAVRPATQLFLALSLEPAAGGLWHSFAVTVRRAGSERGGYSLTPQAVTQGSGVLA